MKIKSIKHYARTDRVYDIETPTHDYILSNGIISHNTMEMFSKQVLSGGCLERGTNIIMHDNTLKQIQDIKEGDFVKSNDGKSRVTHTWDPDTLEESNPECYEIEFEDGTKVVCSEAHRFMIDNNWVELKNINIGDKVSVV